jgi:hypothetical protein
MVIDKAMTYYHNIHHYSNKLKGNKNWKCSIQSTVMFILTIDCHSFNTTASFSDYFPLWGRKTMILGMNFREAG